MIILTDEQCDTLLSIPAWYEGSGRETEQHEELRAQLKSMEQAETGKEASDV